MSSRKADPTAQIQPPGVLVITFVAILIPLLIPIIQQFWPVATVWWSALLVAVLYALLSAVYLVYRRQLTKAGLSVPPLAPMADASPGPDEEDYTYYPPPAATPAPTASFMRKWLLG